MYKNIKEKYVNVHVIFRNEFKAYIWRIGIYVPSMPTTLMTPKLKFCILIEQYTETTNNQVKIMKYNT